MKNHIAWIALISLGVLLLATAFILPAVSMKSAASVTQDDPIAIIGGAEQEVTHITDSIIGGANLPTYIYVYSVFGGGLSIALTAMGGLSLIAGIVVAITNRKRSL